MEHREDAADSACYVDAEKLKHISYALFECSAQDRLGF